MNNTDIYSKAFKEVYIILNSFGKEITDKIPASMMNFIEEHMDKNYIFFMDEKIPIESQNFKDETLGIISLIYRDYIASEEERKKMVEDDESRLNKLQVELSEKYNYDNLFKNRVDEEIEHTSNNEKIIEYKESAVKKIISKIKGFFHKI